MNAKSLSCFGIAMAMELVCVFLLPIPMFSVSFLAFLAPLLGWRKIFFINSVEGFYVAIKVAQYIPIGVFALAYIPFFALSGTWTTFFVYMIYRRTKLYKRIKNLLGGIY